MTYCERCNRNFGSWSAFYRHKADSSRHNICESCSKDFSTWTGLKEHWVQSPRHPYCQRCDEHFDDFSELEDHYEDSHYYCSPCKKIFANDFGLQEHYRQSNLHHCIPCKRLFQSENNLKSVNQYHHKLICIMFTDRPIFTASQFFCPSSKGRCLPFQRLWLEIRLSLRACPSSRRWCLSIWN